MLSVNMHYHQSGPAKDHADKKRASIRSRLEKKSPSGVDIFKEEGISALIDHPTKGENIS